MSLSQFSTIDLVTRDPDGREWLIMVSGTGWRPEDEARLYVQLLIKSTSIRRYQEQQRAAGQESAIRLICSEEPPVSVLEHMRHIDGQVTLDLERAPQGRPPRFPNRADGTPDIDALQAENARSFAAQHGADRLDFTLESLDRVDEVVFARRASEGLGPNDTAEDLQDGDLVVLAGAYVGETLRHAVGGQWAFDPSISGMMPVHLCAGPKHDVRVNVLGKVHRCLRHGQGDALLGFGEYFVQHHGPLGHPET